MRAFTTKTDLAELKSCYLISLAQDFEALTGLLSEIEFGFAEARTYEDLRRLAHVQAGNAATFGFNELGDAARAVDTQLSHRDNQPEVLASLLANWRHHLHGTSQGYH